MSTLRIDNFMGIAPILDSKKLPPGGAEIAEWARLDGGDLRAFQEPATVASYGNYNITYLFPYRYDPSASRTWMAWSSASSEIDAVRSPVPGDAFRRLYWTDSGTYPRYLQNPTPSDVLPYSENVRVLGIPKPPSGPTVSLAGVGSNVVYGSPSEIAAIASSITKAKPAVVHFDTGTAPGTVNAHPFQEGERVQVTITGGQTDNSTNMSEISGKEFIVATVTSSSIELRGSDTSAYGDYNPDSHCLKVEKVFAETQLESRVYVVTFVSDDGAEGPPSLPSALIDVAPGRSVVVNIAGNMPTPVSSNDFSHVTRARLYRTVTGQSGTSYFLCSGSADITLNRFDNAFSFVFTDSTPTERIGELCPSTDWVAPVQGLRGLTAMQNGFLLGWKANTVWASEAYIPHAWPDKYRKVLQNNVVGIGVIAQGAVVATDGRPQMLSGSDPGSLTWDEVALDAPCINRRAIVSTGTAVIYPTFDGLAYVSPSGSRIVTQSHYSKKQWQALWASDYWGAWYDNYYIALSETAPGIAFRLTETGLQVITLPGLNATALATDVVDDSLQFIVSDGSYLNTQQRFDAGSVRNYHWRSQVFVAAKPINFAAIRVFADAYPVFVTVRYRPLVNVFGNPYPEPGAWSEQPLSVRGPEPQRLPSGFLSTEWQIDLAGSSSIQSAALFASMADARAQA